MLRGSIADRDPKGEVIIDVGGVGYVVVVTPSTLAQTIVGDEVTFHVHHHFREADQTLYGFATKEDRIAFQGLLGAHGVGPSLALAIIATHGATRLSVILTKGDLAALCDVPGVGKKTAQRLLVELKDKLVISLDDSPVGGPPESSGEADVRDALTNLGYNGKEISKVLNGIDTSADVDSGDLLKHALQALASG
jgi:Holliday junction DNA helicase RuvA